MAASDKKLFRKDLEQLNILDHSLPEFTYKNSAFIFPNAPKKVVIDFKEIASKKIILNGFKIDLSQLISYPRILILVRDILKSSTSRGIGARFSRRRNPAQSSRPRMMHQIETARAFLSVSTGIPITS